MKRRSFLGAMLAACAAPAIVKAEILMPVRQIIGMDFGVPGDCRVIARGVMEIGTWEGFRFIEAQHDHSVDALRYMMEAQDQKLAARMARIKREILTHAEPREILGLGWGPDGYTALVHPSNAGLFKDTIKFRRLARG